MDEGNCEALLPMWYHDKKSGTCHKFEYGGCGGNRNNFMTWGECEKTCKVTSSGHGRSGSRWTRGTVSNKGPFFPEYNLKNIFGFRLD